MRRRVAQLVVFGSLYFLAAKPHVRAQNAGCPAGSASASDNKESSGPEISIAGVTFSRFIQLPISDQDQLASSIKQQTYSPPFDDSIIEEGLERVRAGWQNHGYFNVQLATTPRH
jgi:hypothetical protein